MSRILHNNDIQIPDDCKSDLIKAMKIGYYKEFFKQGLITAEQLEKLIEMQNDNKDIAAQFFPLHFSKNA